MHEFNLPAKKRPVTEKISNIRPGEVKELSPEEWDLSPEEWDYIVKAVQNMKKQPIFVGNTSYRIYSTWTSTDDFYNSSSGF